MARGLTEQQAREVMRCTLSCDYFVENWLWREDAKEGKAPFRPYAWQKDLLAKLEQKRNVVMYKSRQIGGSWPGAAYGLWRVAFRPYQHCHFMSEKEEKAIGLLDKVKFLYDTCRHHETGESGLFLFPERGDWGKSRVSFLMDVGDAMPAESSIDSLTTTTSSMQSYTSNFVMMDEMERIEHQEETFGSMVPSTSRGGHWFVLSTPGDAGSMFHQLVVHGESGQRDWDVMPVHWSDCPDLDEVWFIKQTAGMSKAMVDREYNLKWASIGDPAFDPTDVVACYKNREFYPELPDLIDQTQIIYIGIDCSEGGDQNALIVLNEKGIQIGEVVNQDTIGDWAGVTVEIDSERIELPGTVAQELTKYDHFLAERTPKDGIHRKSVCLIEQNSVGQVLLNRLVSGDYRYIVIEQIATSAKSKPEMIENLALMIEGHLITITDHATFVELQMYQRLGRGRFGGAKNYHDDRVIALALAAWAAKKHGFVRVRWDAKQEAAPKRLVQQKPDADAPLGTILKSAPFSIGKLNEPWRTHGQQQGLSTPGVWKRP